MDRVAVSVPHPGHMGQITDTRGFPPCMCTAGGRPPVVSIEMYCGVGMHPLPIDQWTGPV
jgi:hypothetical protein